MEDGWICRSTIIWAKPNPMPESVTDRPTKSHEYLFLMTKQERYYFDQEAVRENGSDNTVTKARNGRADKGIVGAMDLHGTEWGQSGNGGFERNEASTRNIRSVWTIPTESYAGAHFATFPRKLVEPCVKAGTSERGACPHCGKTWKRMTEAVGKEVSGHPRGANAAFCADRAINGATPMKTIFRHLGWRPTCSHDAEPVPCTVFDPFMGSGTTLVVAEALGRVGIGCDLSSDYLAQARRRIERPHQPLTRQREPVHPLFAHMEDA
jgi:hypothetical protein